MKDPDPDDTPQLKSLFWGRATTFVNGNFPSFIIQPRKNESDPGTYIVIV
jgi:hypothetical protein